MKALMQLRRILKKKLMPQTIFMALKAICLATQMPKMITMGWQITIVMVIMLKMIIGIMRRIIAIVMLTDKTTIKHYLVSPIKKSTKTFNSIILTIFTTVFVKLVMVITFKDFKTQTIPSKKRKTKTCLTIRIMIISVFQLFKITADQIIVIAETVITVTTAECFDL